MKNVRSTLSIPVQSHMHSLNFLCSTDSVQCRHDQIFWVTFLPESRPIGIHHLTYHLIGFLYQHWRTKAHKRELLVDEIYSVCCFVLFELLYRIILTHAIMEVWGVPTNMHLKVYGTTLTLYLQCIKLTLFRCLPVCAIIKQSRWGKWWFRMSFFRCLGKIL